MQEDNPDVKEIDLNDMDVKSPYLHNQVNLRQHKLTEDLAKFLVEAYFVSHPKEEREPIFELNEEYAALLEKYRAVQEEERPIREKKFADINSCEQHKLDDEFEPLN
ncbi:MAG: hypothetical protein KTR28_05880 [Micavibrio sp.]|nr:hypothetical protein [Micavibrio sp.]